MDTKRKTRIVIPHISAFARKEKRRQDAEARQVKYESLTIPQRIKLVKSRRGESKRELSRLNKHLEWETAQKAQKVAAKVDVKSKSEGKPVVATKKVKKAKKSKSA